MVNVTFITGNADKAAYFSRHMGMDIAHQSLDLEEMQSTSLEEIVEHKVRQAFATLQSPVLVEDVALGFDGLNGLPGPFVKFFVNVEDGLEKMCRMCDGLNNRSATASCVFGYFDGKRLELFKGTLSGSIAVHPAGDSGFGWDKIFCPAGYGGRTRAELTPEEDEQTYTTIKPFAKVREFLLSLH